MSGFIYLTTWSGKSNNDNWEEPLHSFHLNGHSSAIHPFTQKLEPQCIRKQTEWKKTTLQFSNFRFDGQESKERIIRWKAIEQYFTAVLFVNPLTPRVKPWVIQSFLTFESMYRTLKCDHSLESCWGVLYCGAVCFSILDLALSRGEEPIKTKYYNTISKVNYQPIRPERETLCCFFY